MDAILSAALCSTFVTRSPDERFTKLKSPFEICQDDIGPNEMLLHHLIKYSLTTPMHPAAIRKGLVDLDRELLGKLSGQKLQLAVDEWSRKESILINIL